MDPNTTDIAPPKNKGGRPKGAKGRRKPFEKEPLPEKKRQMFWGCFTVREWQDKFKSLSADKQFDILARLEPKDLAVKSTSESTFHLVIQGLAPKVLQPGGYVSGALPTYTADTTTEVSRLKSLPPSVDVPPAAVRPEPVPEREDRMKNVIAAELDQVLGRQDNAFNPVLSGF